MIILIFINLLFSFNINDTNHDGWNDLSNQLSIEKVNLIRNYIDSNGDIETIYKLIDIKGININDIHTLRNLVYIETNLNDISLSKRLSYKLEYWLSSSENQEGLSENWLDQYFNPMNVNDMNYDDLNRLPNLSPIDVKAVLLQKKKGYINGTFELKNSPGISYYGYKNLVDFVSFSSSINFIPCLIPIASHISNGPASIIKPRRNERSMAFRSSEISKTSPKIGKVRLAGLVENTEPNEMFSGLKSLTLICWVSTVKLFSSTGSISTVGAVFFNHMKPDTPAPIIKIATRYFIKLNKNDFIINKTSYILIFKEW